MVVDDTSSVATAAMKDETASAIGGKLNAEHPPIGLSISLSDISYAGTSVLKNFNIDLEPGSITCLLGPSGVGKTSILKSVAGIIPLAEQSFLRASDGKNIADRVSYMDQKDLLLPWASVLDNLRHAFEGINRIPTEQWHCSQMLV